MARGKNGSRISRGGESSVIEQNLRAIERVERAALEQRSVVDKASDAIARFAGSSAFILGHVAVFAGWIAWNMAGKPFDPFPFSLLTLVVSLEAILLTAFILRAQNRMSQMADRRAQLDLQIDMLAEEEMTAILRMVNELCKKQGIELDHPRDVKEMLKRTRIRELASKVEQRLPE